MVVASEEAVSAAESRDRRTDQVGLERIDCAVDAGDENARR